jgi:hypothetical protein
MCAPRLAWRVLAVKTTVRARIDPGPPPAPAKGQAGNTADGYD